MGEERRLAIEADLAGNRSVGRDAAIAEGDEAEVNDGGEAVPEDPREIVDDEAGAERAQRLVIDRHRDPPSGAWRRGEGEQYEGQDEDSRKNSRGGRTRTTSHGASGERKRELKAPPFFFLVQGASQCTRRRSNRSIARSICFSSFWRRKEGDGGGDALGSSPLLEGSLFPGQVARETGFQEASVASCQAGESNRVRRTSFAACYCSLCFRWCGDLWLWGSTYDYMFELHTRAPSDFMLDAADIDDQVPMGLWGMGYVTRNSDDCTYEGNCFNGSSGLTRLLHVI